jgi:hypothetical protein
MVSAGRTSCAQTIEVVAAGPLPPVPNQIGALRMTRGLPRVAKPDEPETRSDAGDLEQALVE